MKIELGKKSTQKIPVIKDPIEEDMRALYKQETGSSALYKRNGEWHESKKYKDFRNGKLAKLHEEVQKEERPLQTITDEQLAEKNLFKIFSVAGGIEKHRKKLIAEAKDRKIDEGYSIENSCMECGNVTMVNPGTACCKSCDDKLDEKGRQEKEGVPPYDENMQRRCLFLWRLMTEKMDFYEDAIITAEETEQLTEIRESLKYWLEGEEKEDG